MTSTSKFVLGILGAAAVGAVIGLLIAPEKGSETLKKIGDTTGKWVDSMDNLLVRSKDGLRSQAQEVQNAVS